MATPTRGAQQVRTLSSVLCSGVHSNERHVHQFQLGALELERTRRRREKQAALRRIQELDARLAHIDTLMRRRQEALSATDADVPARNDDAPQSAEATTQPRRVVRYGS